MHANAEVVVMIVHFELLCHLALHPLIIIRVVDPIVIRHTVIIVVVALHVIITAIIFFTNDLVPAAFVPSTGPDPLARRGAIPLIFSQGRSVDQWIVSFLQNIGNLATWIFLACRERCNDHSQSCTWSERSEDPSAYAQDATKTEKCKGKLAFVQGRFTSMAGPCFKTYAVASVGAA
eukprot:746229-Rhodomonas_salina.1